MSSERDDAELRGQFQRLRRQDEGQGPPFATLREAARRRREPASRGPRGRLRHRLAAAAVGLAMAAGLGALLWLRPRTAQPPEEAAIARLSRWRAPTDSLLRGPGDQLLRGLPRLGESAVGGHLFTSHSSNLPRRHLKP
jgi:hypothetical protein